MDAPPNEFSHRHTTNPVIPDTPTTPSAYDHLRTDGGGDYQPGVYRVVGAGEGTVTLLRVTDGRGRRRSTGTVVTVHREDVRAAFEPAENPDAGFRPVAWLRNLLSGTVRELRSLLGV